MVAGWNGSFLAAVASCSLSFTSSRSPEALFVAGLPNFLTVRLFLQNLQETPLSKNSRFNWKMFENCEWPSNSVPPPAVPTRLFYSLVEISEIAC